MDAVSAAPEASVTAGSEPDAVGISAGITFCSTFDAGNGTLATPITASADGTAAVVDVVIKDEPFTVGTDKRHHKQWFYFKLSNVEGKKLEVNITNAGDCSFPDAWPGSRAVVSFDRVNWPRVPTTYDAERGNLLIEVDATAPVVWVAYFAPFSLEQHQALIAKSQLATDLAGNRICKCEVFGQSLDGRDLELLTIGTGKAIVWFVARQHPGETMAEWWMQGLLGRLLDPSDALAVKLRSQATFYMVPNMNPDGSVRGHLRTNASGANLNREWGPTGEHEAPTLERSPEVYYALKKLDETGCDLFLDVHGDEELPHIFLAPEMGIPKWTDRMAELYRIFVEAQLKANPAFQLDHHYGNDEKDGANLAICGAQVANRFECLSATLEMPYKDTFELQEPEFGWSSKRCEALGASVLDAVSEVMPHLRAPFPFGNGGIGDGLEPPAWITFGYPNPPSEQCW